MELVLATKNIDKIKEIKKVLGKLPLRILTFQDFSSFPSPQESGFTLKENALLKARAVADVTGKLSLADDTGLEVEALNGAPGVHSSRFAGEDASYAENNKKLLSVLKQTPEGKRGATFRCVIALASPDKGKKITVEGVCPGEITLWPRGKGGFGYDPIFRPRGFDKTFAEIPLSEKNRISHRAKALVKIREVFEELIQIEEKFLIGLTGNMGCGKSSLARFFERWGLKVINADEVGHRVLRRDEVRRKVVEAFGDDILNSQGGVSRDKLRQKVIVDKKKILKLNELLHPEIKKKTWEILRTDKRRLAVIEAALLFEAGWDFFMDRVITVYCSEKKQLQRIRKNTDLTREEINGLLKAQLSQEEKVKRADFAIPNEKDLLELEVKTREVFDQILKEANSGSQG